VPAVAKLDVLSLGSATRDLFLESAQFRIIADPTFSTGEAECFALGSKVEIPRITDEIGGGAANTAVSFARLGLSSASAIRIGRDTWGAEVSARIRQEGVRVIATVDRNERTGLSVLLLTRRGERTVLVHRGASGAFKPVDVPAVRPRWYYVTSLAGSRSTLERILRRARSVGARVAWNPGTPELAWGFRRIRPLLHNTVILLNQFEAERLTGKRSPRETVRALIGAGADTAVVTAGKGGATAADRSHMYHAGIHNIPVTDTTGAGDAFGSGFVATLIHGRTIPLALQMATANSESVIRHIGAQAGLRRSLPAVRQRVRVVRLPR
jgi:ribokinase